MIGLVLTLLTAAAAPLTQSTQDAAEQTWHTAAGVGALGVSGEPSLGARLDLGVAAGDFAIRSTSTVWGSTEPDVFSSLAARYRFALTEHLSLAPTIQTIEHASASPLDRQRTLRPGFAVHRSGQRMDWYLSAPVRTWVFQPSPEVEIAPRAAGTFENLLGVEAGASVHIGEAFSVRGGLTGLMPSLGGRYSGEKLYVDILGGTLGLAQLAVLQVGFNGKGVAPR